MRRRDRALPAPVVSDVSAALREADSGAYVNFLADAGDELFLLALVGVLDGLEDRTFASTTRPRTQGSGEAAHKPSVAD